MIDIDLPALQNWLQRSVPEFSGSATLEKFAGGQSNPTYRLTGPSGSLVLRRKPFGPLLPSAHAVDREYLLLSALHPVGFPVPRRMALCADPAVIGSVFYIMSLVEGRNLADGTLPSVARDQRRAHYEAMVDVLADLHSLDTDALHVEALVRPGNYVARQVERWTCQYRASQANYIAEMESLISWLPTTVPAQSITSVIHGDYRLDNLIFDETRPVVRAVLDWELATIGDPLADFANLAVNWILPAEGAAGLAGVDLQAAGLMTLDEAIQRYCLRSGCAGLPDLHWYFAYNLFRLVGIVQGVKQRMLRRNASSRDAPEAVKRIVPLARAAWAEARKAGAPGNPRLQ